MTAMNKAQLRQHIRGLYQGVQARQVQSQSICRHILDSEEYKAARVIGCYVPLPREADILPVLADVLRCAKTLALPLCGKASHMTLRRVADLHELHVGAYGILEPASTAEIIPVQAVDLLLVPLEGIDREGFRLGKGGGYYDHFLASTQVLTIGCALSWQWVDAIPRENWDQPLCACADQYGIHYFNKNDN